MERLEEQFEAALAAICIAFQAMSRRGLPVARDETRL
jgi:hypothetical protein